MISFSLASFVSLMPVHVHSWWLCINLFVIMWDAALIEHAYSARSVMQHSEPVSSTNIDVAQKCVYLLLLIAVHPVMVYAEIWCSPLPKTATW